ncbi:MAG: DNA/RNA nuclease SfsA [Lachnospiraceae bacterium]|nr:DNA/RNA nuclease SfsA [Lachnospiraceae bacterium]MCI8994190.1 DNA/RNA nuclease SfsA [Lachnospiraceae bacterium]MCI9133478.1 DNA/RNA nuclease SfsA [Lachnospiraceae bacterium]
MRYEHIEPAVFLERPNRFIAWVRTERGKEICHVKNTGRCRELLLPGTALFVERNENPKRKTPLDLIAVKKGQRLINMDSQAPNQVVEEWLRAHREDETLLENLGFSRAQKQEGVLEGQGGANGLEGQPGRETEGLRIRQEYSYGDSRFDFFLQRGEEKLLMEVKGVTLEENGIVRFPDAPTERGVKHIRELTAGLQAGYKACLFFVIQMKNVEYMEPNDKTHPAFGEALREAHRAGVRVLAYDCRVERNLLVLEDPVPVRL